ncbi:MAG: pyridoxamine 5'-phosphate oxidase family protein [Acidobacteriota bacterium]
MDAKVVIRELLARSDMGVMATSGPDGPLCSLMAFAAIDPDCLVMATLPDSRKWRNILADPRLSLLVDNRDTAVSREAIRALTLSGRHEPPSPAERQAGLAVLRQRHPHLEGLFATPDVACIRLRVASYLLLTGPVEARFLTDLTD